MQISLSYFFYINIILTLFLAYLFFKKQKEISKLIMITNLYIFFYFLSPGISSFLFDYLGSSSQFLTLFYILVLSFIFLIFSGFQKSFLGAVGKLNFALSFLVVLLGAVFGLGFILLQEPVGALLYDISTTDTLISLFSLASIAFLIALSEQLAFSGIFFNAYKKVISEHKAKLFIAALFVLFHFLKFDILSQHYALVSPYFSPFYLTGYYLLLFFFMYIALQLYTLKSDRYKGSFLYPLLLHFVTDFFLFTYFYFKI